MKYLLKIVAITLLMLMTLSAFSQNKNQVSMKQENLTEKQVCIIDKIIVPVKAASAYHEKSVYIRNILRQQPGFVKYEIFQQEDVDGNLTIITIATWKNQQHLDLAKSVIQEEMRKTGLDMPEFLKQQGIAMERSIYYPVEER